MTHDGRASSVPVTVAHALRADVNINERAAQRLGDPRKVVPPASTTERSSSALGLPTFRSVLPGVLAVSKNLPGNGQRRLPADGQFATESRRARRAGRALELVRRAPWREIPVTRAAHLRCSGALAMVTTDWLSARRHRLSLWCAGRPSCPRYGVGHDATESLQAKAQPGPRGARQGRLRRPHRT
jgi:hypothetical protein